MVTPSFDGIASLLQQNNSLIRCNISLLRFTGIYVFISRNALCCRDNFRLFDGHKQLVEEGFEAVLSCKLRATPPVPQIFDGAKEARLIQLACSEAPPGQARWTLNLLANKVVELKIVDAASRSTVGRVLKKTYSNPISRKCGLSRRSKTARS